MHRKVRKALKLVSDISFKIPGKNDTTLQKVIKAISIVETVSSLGGNNYLSEFIKEKKLIRTNNSVLVDLIFSSKLFGEFLQRNIILGDEGGYVSTNIVELSRDDIGSLYFVENKYHSGDVYREGFILHKEGFDFQKLMDLFWKCYDGKLHIMFSLTGFSCSEFPAEQLQIYGKNAETARDLAIQHLKYANAKISRSYLLLGTPGTGKSSCAMLFATKIGQRILKIEASALVKSGKGLRFIFEALMPDFVLIEDIDKDQDVINNMASVLSSIEWLKISNPEVTIIFTANEIEKLDKAFWRPGRVDSITIFDAPSVKDRIDIVKGFIEQFKVVLPDEYTIERVVQETEGMSPVWLREIVLRFKYDSPDNIIGICRKMFELINKSPSNPTQVVSQPELIVQAQDVTNKLFNKRSNGKKAVA